MATSPICAPSGYPLCFRCHHVVISSRIDPEDLTYQGKPIVLALHSRCAAEWGHELLGQTLEHPNRPIVIVDLSSEDDGG